MTQEKLPLKERSPLVGALVGVLTGVAFGLIGFLLATIPATRFLGATLFYLVPISAGIGIAFTMRGQGSFAAAGLLSILISMFFLIAARREGPLCAVMAFPLVFVALSIGIGIGYFIQKLLGDRRAPTATTLLLLPLLITGAHHIERKNENPPRVSAIKTTVFLPAPPNQVWPYIQSVDSISGPKPFLMYIGLPIPQRCVLRGTLVGSKRVCYFDQGFIEETILDWDPPHRMKLSIDRTNLPGRHWLGFEEAEYTLEAVDSGTSVTRTTTITSGLSPSWYWDPLERWGVASEHEYLFQDLKTKFPAATSAR